MIIKPTSIITSLGRTGTLFFATLFREIIPNITALHEPDVFKFYQYQGWSERINSIPRQLKISGVQNLIIRKMMGNWSLIKISDGLIKGSLDYDVAISQVFRQRCNFILNQRGTSYFEANIGFYGLIDVLPNIFKQHKIAYIVRDGRDWIQSSMSWGQMYGKGKYRRYFAHKWPTAIEMDDDVYGPKWYRMARFEKLCWAWSRLNRYAYDSIQNNPDAKLIRFEKIFNSENSYQNLENLLSHLTTFPDLDLKVSKPITGWIDKKIHKSNKRFPKWEEWSSQQKQQFMTICGPLMERLGYKI